MTTKPTTHPPENKLRAFAQGTLPAADFQEVEEHLSHCDRCCETLAGQPDGTLMELAREAATAGFRTGQTPKTDAAAIPAALVDHPRYRILERIGTGGMGAVYKAEHRMMERTVALKVVHPWMLAHPQAVERFKREVRVAAKLNHPNVVAAFDADDAGDVHFLIMEFVDGLSLDRRLADGKVISAAHACDWMRQAALGLQYAHEQGMVHRDIKPQNLMLTREGVVKILDFGLTRIVEEQAANSPTLPDHATREGMILGTPDYIAPEQVADSRSADIRSDIYSLGCTFFHLLTGHTPFAGGTMVDKLHAHGSRGIPGVEPSGLKLPGGWSPEIAEMICAILARMTAINPAERFAEPGEVAKALAKVLQTAKSPQAKVIAPPLPPPAPPPPPALPPISVVAAKPAASTTKMKPGVIPRWQFIVAGIVLAACVIIPVASQWSGTPEKNGMTPTPVISGRKSHRILLVIPSKGLWFPDYKRVVDAVEMRNKNSPHSTELVVAGTSLQPASMTTGSMPGRVVPDRLLNSKLTSLDYDAIIVVGFETWEYVPGGPFGSDMKRLLDEFQAEQKPIASLCAGQRILLEHDLARGKQVAQCQYVLNEAIANAGARLGTGSVVKDGLLFTASTDREAGELVRQLLLTPK